MGINLSDIDNDKCNPLSVFAELEILESAANGFSVPISNRFRLTEKLYAVVRPRQAKPLGGCNQAF